MADPTDPHAAGGHARGGGAMTYLDRVRELPCAMCGLQPAGNAHHRTGAGMGRRAPDDQTMPLCGSGTTGCHGSLHTLTFGPFKGWAKDELRQWQRDAMWRTWEALGVTETMGCPERLVVRV
jgi:hypothetical protein